LQVEYGKRREERKEDKRELYGIDSASYDQWVHLI
jgi:hypothetical protein